MSVYPRIHRLPCTANKDDNSINGEAGIEAEDLNINGEDGNEVVETNSLESPNSQVSVQDIERTKQMLIQTLNDNYDIFNQIVSYFEGSPSWYYCRKEEGEIVAHIRNDVSGFPGSDIDISEIEVGEQMVYIINELGFLSIAEDDDAVGFTLVSGGKHPYGGSYSQGLICNKSDAGDGKIEEWDRGHLGADIHVRDGWFYHFRYGNH